MIFDCKHCRAKLLYTYYPKSSVTSTIICPNCHKPQQVSVRGERASVDLDHLPDWPKYKSEPQQGPEGPEWLKDYIDQTEETLDLHDTDLLITSKPPKDPEKYSWIRGSNQLRRVCHMTYNGYKRS